MIKKILQFQKEASFGATIGLTLVVVLLINLIGQSLFTQFDLTQNKDYSISPVSKSLLKNLPDVVTIKTYFSSDAPAQYAQVKRDVADILGAYESYSGGKIKVQNIDPGADKAVQQELQMKGIPQLQFNDYGKDKLQVVNGYLGIIIEYGDKTEVMPVVQDTNNFEYQMTVKLQKITSEKATVVGYVTNGSTTPLETLKTAGEALAGLYELQPVSLAGKADIPNDVKTLLLVNPESELGESALKKLDKFLMSGGSIAIFASGVKVDQGLKAQVNNLDLNKLLDKYGLIINSDLVLDQSSGIASFNQGFMTFSLEYPFWPKVIKGGFSDSPIASKLQGVIFPWPSSITISDRANEDGRKTEVLAKSSKKSWLITEAFNLAPQQNFSPTNLQSENLAVLMSGKIKSAYGQGETEKGRLVLVSNGKLMNDNFLQQQPDNGNMFVNIVDALTLDQNFSMIRAKGVTSRPIKSTLSDQEKTSMRYSNVFGVTVLVVAFGAFRYTRRRKASTNA